MHGIIPICLSVAVVIGSFYLYSNHSRISNNDNDNTVNRARRRQLKSSNNGPEVAWLMSFPSSGTTYTQRVVQEASQTTVATFYGSEFVDRYGRTKFQTSSRPLYEDKLDGPFVLSNLDVPKDGYILSKTHCGGYCFSDCKPRGYILNPHQFLGECVHGARMEPRDNEQGYERIWFDYDPSIVKKAVQIFRSPFDNIISRFHHEVNMNKNNSPHLKWDEYYSNDPEGFKSWCRANDNRNFELEKQFLHEGITGAFEGVPCHGEFFRYVQWHNNAFSVTDDMNIATHVVYYEEYDRNSKATVKKLLDFLEQPMLGQIPQFKMNVYEGYYTEEDRLNVFRMLKELASVETWRYLRYYMTEEETHNIFPIET